MRTLSEIETMVCEVLSSVCDDPPERIDRNLPFDRFGLDSLARVGLITELSKRLGCEVDAEAALECETPSELARFIQQLSGSHA